MISNTQLYKLSSLSLLSNTSSLLAHGHVALPPRPFPKRNLTKLGGIHASFNQSSVTTTNTISLGKDAKVKATVTVQLSVQGVLTNLGVTRPLDDITDLIGKSMVLELVSADLDPNTGAEKATIKANVHRVGQEKDEVKYECSLVVPGGFGQVGAVMIENEHHKEMHLKNIVLEGLYSEPVTFWCNSWVHSKFDNPEKRVFFTNKSYLPGDTPEGLKRLREKELEILRGNGQGERKTFERIYDYDTYNDLGDPDDTSADVARPVLGGKEHPYPRRCRTGRPMCKKDPKCETRSTSVYVPRDETFAEVKQATFSAKTLKCVLHALLPTLEISLIDVDGGFPLFTAIDKLFNEGVSLNPDGVGIFKLLLPRIVKNITQGENDLLLFEPPEMINRDIFSWLKDEEFARQTLAGLNPYCLELVTEWPLTSKLDPKVYGSPDSLITSDLIQKEIGGELSVEEAVKGKRLFMLDYHDKYLPFVNTVRELKGTTLYASRTIFFLTRDGTLRPLAIELTRPPCGVKPQWRQVFSPTWDATSRWLWKLAKAHVCAHDAGYHQLISHWLRTHCCTEPYIIAANRQMSAMHPIYRLLHPHFRYTMEINALARESLINAGGVIESTFSPGKHSIVLSSAIYDQTWRFDMEALPADLIRRGLAVEDPTAEHGLKLTIQDYPFANDGLVLWDAIKQWVTDYVNHYYPDAASVQSDTELQAWWTDVRTKGHADKKDEPWWPVLNTQETLIHTLTTIIWVPSGHHAAVNFGQYLYGGYFPNRPTIVRTNMPTEDPVEEEYNFFLQKPEVVLLKSFPSQIQATKVMAVLDVLSTHAPDEEYLGDKIEPSWEENPLIKAAFEQFSGRLKELEGTIDARNANLDLKNRSGAGIVPYELLKPMSVPGATGMGVPNSISI